MKEIKPTTIDEYISSFPQEIQDILQNLRSEIKKVVPDATEKISYQMPCFYLNGILVYFAAYKNHIGFYPTASGIIKFKENLTQYETSPGTVKFPIDKPLPMDMIIEIVKYRAKENIEKSKKAKK